MPGDSDDDGYSDMVELSEDTDPFNASSKPIDFDADLIPDSIDPDDDNDGANDFNDIFPRDVSEREDTDGDGVGDNADNDDDNDGYSDVVEVSENSDSLNPFSKPLDSDGDLIPDSTDPDDDDDGVPDTEDVFSLDAAESSDFDRDGMGDNADLDKDNDHVLDATDVFPLNAAESMDTDGDGLGDHSDPDNDGDGINNSEDAFSLDRNRSVEPGRNDSNAGSGDLAHDSTAASPSDRIDRVASPNTDERTRANPTSNGPDGVAEEQGILPPDTPERIDPDGDGIGNDQDSDERNPLFSEDDRYPTQLTGSRAFGCQLIVEREREDHDAM